MPSTVRSCWKSSDNRTLQPACCADRKTRASQKENACNRWRSIAARMSATSGTTTSNSESISTFHCARGEATISFRVTVQQYSCNTWRERTPVPSRRCSATRSIARLCFAGARLSSAYTRIWVSKKLRAFMDFVAIEAPTARIAGSRQTPEFFNTPFSIFCYGQLRKVFADDLAEALAKRLFHFSGTRNSLLFNRSRSVQEH